MAASIPQSGFTPLQLGLLRLQYGAVGELLDTVEGRQEAERQEEERREGQQQGSRGAAAAPGGGSLSPWLRWLTAADGVRAWGMGLGRPFVHFTTTAALVLASCHAAQCYPAPALPI